jgi:hypothetical protein
VTVATSTANIRHRHTIERNEARIEPQALLRLRMFWDELS